MQKEVTIPTSWEGITIQKFVDYYRAAHAKDVDEFDKELHLLSILTGLDVSDIECLALSDIKMLIEKTSFVKQLDIKDNLPGKFICKGKWFKVNYEVNKLSGGQYIDLMDFCKDDAKIMENLHFIIATITTPLTLFFFEEKYDHITNRKRRTELYNESFKNRAELFRRHLPVSIAYPLALFFYAVWEKLLPSIEDCLKGELKGMGISLAEGTSESGGDGTTF
jgi:hypothetical protein